MKRYHGYDPEEYIHWQPDPEVMEHYTSLAFSAIKNAGPFKLNFFTNVYKNLLRVRLHDIVLRRWVKTGVISKAWLGTGEEAVTVGNVMALEKKDLVGPMIRNAGACLLKGMPLDIVWGYYLGVDYQNGGGRDLHAGSLKYDVITPISHVASLVPVCTGIAISHQIKKSDRVVTTWIGDGSTRTGEFHEGVNLAAVKKAPCLFVLQNNQVALGSKYDDHFSSSLDDMAEAYGVIGLSADGNNVVDVFSKTKKAVALCRQGEGPVMLSVNTFRMGGHATHDENEARELFDEETFRYWGKRDPIGCYEEFLVQLPIHLKNGQRGRRGQFALDNRKLLTLIEDKVFQFNQYHEQLALEKVDTHQPDPRAVLEGVYSN